MKCTIICRIVATALIVFVGGFSFSYCQTNTTRSEFWKQLGITEMDVKLTISSGFFHPLTPDWRLFQKIGKEDRPAFVMALGNYIKKYVTTSSFAKDYMQFREGQIKANTPPPALTKEQIAKRNIANLERDISSAEKNCNKSADPNTRKACQQSLDYLKKQLVELKAGKSEQIDYEFRMEEQRYNEAKQLFDEWLKDHPESMRELIRHRLNEFLTLTRDIDYQAVYVEGYSGGETGGEGHFKNPVYNQKSYGWKTGFLAGKELTEASRAFIQQWLREFN